MNLERKTMREQPTRRGRKRTAAAASASEQQQPQQQKMSAVGKRKGAPKAWEAVEIKLEELGEENGVDIKPDVNELQQSLTLQHVLGQQQHHQHQQTLQTLQPLQPLHPPQSLAQATTMLTPSTVATSTASAAATVATTPALAMLPPSAANRLVIIGDLACVATAGAGLTFTPLGTVNSGGIICGGNGGVSANAIHAPNVNATAALTAAASAASSTTKILDDSFEKDEFDLQESDTDEEGYSDIDFDDDDELIEDDDDNDVYDPVWTNQSTAPRKVFKFDRPQADIGLVGRPKSVSPEFYFGKLVNEQEPFFRKLAQGCNERAQQLYQDNKVGGQTYLKEISNEEMQIFFGLCLQMSTFQLPTLADYWSEQAHCAFKGFGAMMSLNRFQMIMHALNFERLKDEPTKEEESFGILRPLLDFFNQQMDNIFKCGQRLVLNEPIIFWKGKHSWLRDMREKFRCNAVMLHFLTENTGLLLKIAVDVECKERKQYVRNSKLLVTQRLALAKELLQEKLGLGHTVYASTYYSSYGLGLDLAREKTYCTGLLDNKRYGNSKELIVQKLQNNDFATKYAAPMMMGKWCRREKCVYFYSSDCLAIYAKETSRLGGDPRLKLIKELDWQLRSPANIRDAMQRYQIGLERREIKWDRHVAIYIFNLMVLNAYVLYTMYAQFGRARIIELHLKDTTKLKSYAEFRQNVIASLLKTPDKSAELPPTEETRPANVESEEDECEISAVVAPQASPAQTTQKQLLEKEHMPMVIPRRKGKAMKKKCRICRKGGMLTLSKLCCESCPGMPGLCETPCFKMWHDQLKKSIEAGVRIKTRTFGTSDEQTIYF